MPNRLHNLPAPLTSLVGRARELGEVQRLLGTARLVTLTGPGGSGKTRLALQAAARVAPAYADGAWFVALENLQDPDLVWQAVAGATGPGGQLREPDPVTLGERLAGKALLLVLDNCEQITAACRELVAALLQRAAGIRILATSREPLGVPGEVIYPVPGLSLPAGEPKLSPEEWLRYEAVQLFVERAVGLVPGFALTHGNAPAVAEICRRLDGLPLAIELAAARIRVLTPAEIAARLDDRFRLLTGGSRLALPRQQTLSAAVAWSYDLLDEVERRLWHRLSVFAGSFTFDAVAGVCGSEGDVKGDLLDTLSQLVDKSLVAAGASGGETRYWLLETTRCYGLERLRESGEEQMAARQHHAWYLRYLRQARAEMEQGDQARWLQRVRWEQENIRAALRWSTQSGEAAACLELAAEMGVFWNLQGDLAEGCHWLTLVLAAAPAPTYSRGKALYWLGYMAAFRGNAAVAVQAYEEGLAVMQALGDRPGTAMMLMGLGEVERLRGDHEHALKLVKAGAALEQATAGEGAPEATLYGRALIGQWQGDWAAAMRHYEEALAIHRERGNRIATAAVLFWLGYLNLRQGELDRAYALYRESLEIRQAVQMRCGVAQCLEGMAGPLVVRGEAERALRLCGAASRLREEIEVARQPDERPFYQETLAAARAALGERAFTAAWEAGRALSLEQAVACASEPPGESPEAWGLTEREVEVARAVARGLSDREIAAELVISPRTVDRHLRSIFSKLDLKSRSQLAVLVTRKGI